MNWAPPGRALWDPWFVSTGDGYRMYHLSAPAGLSKGARDDQSEIWQASSADLVTWRSLGPAIRPGPPGSDDDLACWTGHTVKADDGWLTFYTGRNRREGSTQHVLVAHSPDGRRWHSSHRALLRAPQGHPTYLDAHPRVFPAWRDPFYLRDGKRHLLLITALGRGEGAPGCLAVAEATCADGPYRLRPPLIPTGYYDQIEVAQLIFRAGRWLILFSTAASDYAPEWAAEVGAQTGLHAWVSQRLDGPFFPLDGTGHVPGFGTASGLYGVHVIADRVDPTVDWAVGWHWAPECFTPGGSPNSPLAGVGALTVGAPRRIAFGPGRTER